MATTRTTLVFPEQGNAFYREMSSLLPRSIYNVTRDFIIPRLGPVEITGVVVPYSTVVIFVNGVNVTGTQNIVADAEGNWSSAVILGPGQSTVQVQFYPPTISVDIQSAFSALNADAILEHPTLFSQFSMDCRIVMLLMDGIDVFAGGYVPSGTHPLAKFDTTTGFGTILSYGSSSTNSGIINYMALDSSYLYVSHTMGSGTVLVSHWDKTLTTRVDHIVGSGFFNQYQIPQGLHSDGSSLFYTRYDAGAGYLVLGKLDPVTMTPLTSEINIHVGPIYSYDIFHNQFSDDGTNLMIPATEAQGATQDSDIVGYHTFIDGDPGLGGSTSVGTTALLLQKVVKSTMAIDSTWAILSGQVYTYPTPTPFITCNSMIHFGGYYYRLAQSDPGKIIKFQEQVGDTNSLTPVGITPLPFSTLNPLGPDSPVPLMVLGPDNRLYVTANGHVARLAPDAASFSYIPRGAVSVTATLNDMAVVSEVGSNADFLSAPQAIWTDRSVTYSVVPPASAPVNLRSHMGFYDSGLAHSALTWDPLPDGNAVLAEMDVNGSGFTQVGTEWMNNAMNTHIGAWWSGKVYTFRVKAFNNLGVSAPSNSSVITVPYLTPPIGDQTTMTFSNVVGNSVDLQWVDTEIHVGGTTRDHVVHLYRSTDGVNFTEMVGGGLPFHLYGTSIYTTNVLTYTDAAIPGFPCYYYARADQVGIAYGYMYGAGAPSNTVEVLAPPATPINPARTYLWEGLKVSWTPGSGGGTVADYSVKRSVDNGASYQVVATVPGTSYLDADALNYPGDTLPFIYLRYKIRANGPGGSSADSTVLGPVSPVYPMIPMALSGPNSPMVSDASYVYAINAGTPVVIHRIHKADSSQVDDYSVYGPGGYVGGSMILGGFIYLSVNDAAHPTGNVVVKIDTSTMTQVASFYLANGSANFCKLVTNGTDCWAVSGDSSVRVFKFDPAGMSVLQTGPVIISSPAFASVVTALGANVFIGWRSGYSFAFTYLSRIDSTLSIVENVQVGGSYAGPILYSMVTDGSSLYLGGGDSVLYKYGTSPLVFVAQTSVVSLNYASFVYGGGFIYTPGTTGSDNGDVLKFSTAPALVSSIKQIYTSGGATDSSCIDGTYVYVRGLNSYIARESLADF